MSIFSENLKFLRKERGLSQQELADSLEMSQRTYSNYELGHCEPPISTLIKLAAFYRVSIDFLVGFGISHFKNERRPRQ